MEISGSITLKFSLTKATFSDLATLEGKKVRIVEYKEMPSAHQNGKNKLFDCEVELWGHTTSQLQTHINFIKETFEQ